MGARANTQTCFRLGQFESIKENAGHFVVIMLPSVDQDLFVSFLQLPTHRGSLDELRPRSDDGDDLHSSLAILSALRGEESADLGLHYGLLLGGGKFLEFPHHFALLIASQLRIHGKRKDFRGGLFRDRKISFLITEPCISVLKVQWNRIVNPRPDATELKYSMSSSRLLSLTTKR